MLSPLPLATLATSPGPLDQQAQQYILNTSPRQVLEILWRQHWIAIVVLLLYGVWLVAERDRDKEDDRWLFVVLLVLALQASPLALWFDLQAHYGVLWVSFLTTLASFVMAILLLALALGLAAILRRPGARLTGLQLLATGAAYLAVVIDWACSLLFTTPFFKQGYG